MRAPSLFTQCLPGLVPHDRVAQSMSITSDKEMHLPSPAVEILPSKMRYPYRNAVENIDCQEVSLFKGRVSVSDIIGSELKSSKPDASLKSWDSSFDLVNILKHEIRDGQLSFRGKRVLELSCGHGIPGIFACLKGASTVHFQDLNAETIRRTTIPNVMSNLEQEKDKQSKQPETPLTPSRQILSPTVHFYAGEWEELPGVLSVVEKNVLEASPVMNLSFSEDDFIDRCSYSSHDGSIMGQEHSSRKSTGSRVWERANESDVGGGYDVILMSDIPHSGTSLKKLYTLIKKCLKPPYGVVFIATKKNYVGFNSTARQLRSLDYEARRYIDQPVEVPSRITTEEYLMKLDEALEVNEEVLCDILVDNNGIKKLQFELIASMGVVPFASEGFPIFGPEKMPQKSQKKNLRRLSPSLDYLPVPRDWILTVIIFVVLFRNLIRVQPWRLEGSFCAGTIPIYCI
ncbi:unnamed protein product [Lactuca virosa]|uniref:Uncharacterized protein n=1 Tax=Lactuca virosa TaxID=75947 RepID=A0AAU9NUF1_9ASTR|nr:unnamed protein product [Lactuca virosa]